MHGEESLLKRDRRVDLARLRLDPTVAARQARLAPETTWAPGSKDSFKPMSCAGSQDWQRG